MAAVASFAAARVFMVASVAGLLATGFVEEEAEALATGFIEVEAEVFLATGFVEEEAEDLAVFLAVVVAGLKS